jgi:hypothetical protein
MELDCAIRNLNRCQLTPSEQDFHAAASRPDSLSAQLDLARPTSLAGRLVSQDPLYATVQPNVVQPAIKRPKHGSQNQSNQGKRHHSP